MELSNYGPVSAGVFQLASKGPAPLRVIGEEGDLHQLNTGAALDQLAGLGAIPGVGGFIIGFPNLNEREAFPSGCVVTTVSRDAALIPAAAGGDVNCGLRLLASRLREHQIEPMIDQLLGELRRLIHVGDEASGPLSLDSKEVDDVLNEGCRFLVHEKRIGKQDDLDVLETEGHAREASAGTISARAKTLTGHQLGTLGKGGSHFVEIEVVEKVFDPESAKRMGIFEGQVVVQIHAGARELGRQVYADYTEIAHASRVPLRLQFSNPQLPWIPLSSKQGERCYSALQAATNFGLANRHVLGQLVRDAFAHVVSDGLNPHLRLVCDLNNNTVRVERWNGEICCVHRRGASSAFPPGHHAIPTIYRDMGQPVILPGSMGADSFLMVTSSPIEELAFGSFPHGVGRAMNRRQAHKAFTAQQVRAQLESRGVRLSLGTDRRVTEEAPGAYRNVGETALLMQRAGLARAVAQLRPKAVLKA